MDLCHSTSFYTPQIQTKTPPTARGSWASASRLVIFRVGRWIGHGGSSHDFDHDFDSWVIILVHETVYDFFLVASCLSCFSLLNFCSWFSTVCDASFLSMPFSCLKQWAMVFQNVQWCPTIAGKILLPKGQLYDYCIYSLSLVDKERIIIIYLACMALLEYG